MSVSGIPYSVLKNLPAGTPPPGVQPNFINPPSRENEVIVFNTVFLTLMWIVVTMRLYAKGRILHSLGWDDYICAIAAVASSVHSAVELDSLQLGLGRHIWDIRAITLLDTSNVRRLSATSITYPIVIYFVKTSILLLYLRIFGVHRPLRLAVYFAIAFFTLFYLAYFGVQVVLLVDCISSASLETGICKNLYSLTIFQAAFNLASDIFVFVLPIPSIMNLQISNRQKNGLVAIFLAGLVACGTSVARLVVIIRTLNRTDKFWHSALSGSLSIVEMDLAIIAACMSTLPGTLARVRIYGLSIYKSLRSRIFTTRRSKKGARSSNTEGHSSPQGKTFDKNYIQLEDGARSGVSGDGVQSSDQLPLWGKP